MTMSGDPFSISKKEYPTQRGYNQAKNSKKNAGAERGAWTGFAAGGVGGGAAAAAGSKALQAREGTKAGFKGQRQMATGKLKSVGAAARTAPAAFKGARANRGSVGIGLYAGALGGSVVGANRGGKKAEKKFANGNSVVKKSSTSAFGVKH